MNAREWLAEDAAAADAARSAEHVVVVGGDNSLTRPVLQGLMNATPGAWDLLTLDAHHDCRAQGVHIVPLHTVWRDGKDAVIASALTLLVARGAERVYGDFDMDVIDRAFAPACPASLPGGMQPDDLLRAAYLFGANPHVVAADLCEVDANADVNCSTVRLMAATFLTFCSGLASRPRTRLAE